MIERVAIAGTDVDLLDVFAAVTIRHGRSSPDDGPLASTCSLSLLNVTRELSSRIRAADELALDVGDPANLVANGGFEQEDVSTWLPWPYGAARETVERDESAPIDGRGSLLVTATSALPIWAYFEPSGFDSLVPVTGGLPYTFAVTFKPTVGARPAHAIELDWYDGDPSSGGAHGFLSYEYAFEPVALGDELRLVITATAPPTATGAVLWVGTDGGGAIGDAFLVDDVKLEQGSTATPFAFPRFRGRITDASFSDGTLSLLAVSSLSWLARRKVGLTDYPEELWSDRVHRVLGDAVALTSWAEVGGTWASSTETWTSVEEGAIVEIGDVDPLLAARPAEPTTLGTYLGELVRMVEAAIVQQPNGAILVQELTARKGRTTIELAPNLVAANPEWTQVDEVTNTLAVEWSGGELSSSDALSIAEFEERAESITTELAVEEDASDLADRSVQNRAWPRWEITRAELLELDAELDVGDPVSIPDLEDGAPLPTYLGVLEGWEDHVEQGHETIDGIRVGVLEWRMVLNLSAPRFSGIGIAWDDLPPEELWSDADTDITWNEPELVLTD